MKVAIIMGSKSDLEVMQQAAQVLADFQVEHHIQIVSAHRTPELMVQFSKEAYDKVLMDGTLFFQYCKCQTEFLWLPLP